MQPPEDEEPREHPSSKPIAFGGQPSSAPHTASEIVAVDGSRFFVCDNNIRDALLELSFAPHGAVASPLIRRPPQRIETDMVDDLEGMMRVDRAL
jgi:hypothetical protein